MRSHHEEKSAFDEDWLINSVIMFYDIISHASHRVSIHHLLLVFHCLFLAKSLNDYSQTENKWNSHIEVNGVMIKVKMHPNKRDKFTNDIELAVKAHLAVKPVSWHAHHQVAYVKNTSKAEKE